MADDPTVVETPSILAAEPRTLNISVCAVCHRNTVSDRCAFCDYDRTYDEAGSAGVER